VLPHALLLPSSNEPLSQSARGFSTWPQAHAARLSGAGDGAAEWPSLRGAGTCRSPGAQPRSAARCLPPRAGLQLCWLCLEAPERCVKPGRGCHSSARPRGLQRLQTRERCPPARTKATLGAGSALPKVSGQGDPTVRGLGLHLQNHRITESQNSRGWKGPLWVI